MIVTSLLIIEYEYTDAMFKVMPNVELDTFGQLWVDAGY
jgi:hypothetical protein